MSVGASRWFARIGSPGLRNQLERSTEESPDDIIESGLRREVFEELGIEIEIVRLAKVDAVLTCRRSRGPTVSTSTTGVFPSRDSANTTYTLPTRGFCSRCLRKVTRSAREALRRMRVRLP